MNRLDPSVAVDLFMEISNEQQDRLFVYLPIAMAAKIAETIPYYDAYVLLCKRSRSDIGAILDRMGTAERLRLLEELPEKQWQELTTQISLPEAFDGRQGETSSRPAVQPIIQARQIGKAFSKEDGTTVQVISPTNLSVEPGIITALLGPSGSGKSTLLRMLSGLAAPSSGEVLWHGRPISECVPNTAIVFQSFALFPWLTVAENVEAPLQARGMPRQERHRKALESLNSVGLKGFENAYPKELSGGMKQRVGFARALAVEPEILFMDEPFSALDVLTAENLRGELMELWLGKKIPTRSIFLVTHNIEEAVTLADRIIVLGRNPGRVRADFRVSLPHPRSRGAAEFVVYVDYIYKLLTQPESPVTPPSPTGFEKKRFQLLPHARRGAIAGLLEMLNARGGHDNLYRLAEDLRMELDDLLPIVEAAMLLDFAKSKRGDLEITPGGKAFAEGDIATRKKLFQDAVLTRVDLLWTMHGALSRNPDQTLPLEFFRDLLCQHYTDVEAARQMETALNWGRYADLFTYDSENDRLSPYRASGNMPVKAGIQEER